MRANHHAVIVAAGVLAASLWVSAARASELTVTATTGQVMLIAHGRSVPPSVGAKLTLPVEIHTGSDGTVDLQQLGSSLHVGPSSTIAVPEAASAGNTIDKIEQSAGYVLYNIKSRKDHPLAVETPYLVSVVKGTVFTIAVEEHAATVALMEGSLDISAPGIPEHVLLKPNQSIRHADGESHLSVRSSASAGVMHRNELRADAAPLVLPEAMQSSQMAQVVRDLADAGAAVAAGHAIATHQALQSSGAGAGLPAGGTSSPGTTSPGSGGSPGAGAPGSSNSGGSPGSSGAGGSSNAGGSGSTGGSVSTGGSASTGGGVTLPSSGSDGSTTGTGNCNGKTNGTGNGNCYGHQSGQGNKP